MSRLPVISGRECARALQREVPQMLGSTSALTRQKAGELLEQTARWKAERAAGLAPAGDEQRLAATAPGGLTRVRGPA